MQKTSFPQLNKPILLMSIVVLCVMLLSACSTDTSGGTPTRKTQLGKPSSPTQPTVVASLTPDATMELQTYQQWISTMQQAHGDVNAYQQRYLSDQKALKGAKSTQDYQNALNTIRGHIGDIQLPALKVEAADLYQQFQQKVATWGQQHTHYNDYDKTTYKLGYEYSDNGAGWVLSGDIDAAQTPADYRQLIEKLHLYLNFFDAMVTNTSDKTPYSSVHATDTQLLTRNNLLNQKAVVVSLQEQAIRVYQNGQLVKAFQVTTGRPNHPSLPGIWDVQVKLTHTVFKSGAPKGSPDYYADTPINFAMQYHDEGYFLHDSWWRADYGPDTQFPHMDATGNASAENGSHGCVNIATDNASWLYSFVDLNTPVIVY
jgi:hypothetical protein